MKKNHGPEPMRQLMSLWRESYKVSRTRAAVPLLRATDPFLYYRKGPLALYALSEYIGEEQVNAALRRLLEKHGSGTSASRRRSLASALALGGWRRWRGRLRRS
ncbi:MAG: hypothetical protein ACR2GG_02300 [Gemmatimonadaceae bacterium]